MFGIEALHLLAVDEHLAIGVPQPEDPAQCRSLSVAFGAGEADDLSAADRERDRSVASAGEVAHLQPGRARSGGSVGELQVGRHPDHQLDDLVDRPVVGGVGALDDAGSDDGEPVGEAAYLRQPVTYVHDGHAVGAAPLDQTLQIGGELHVQRRRGLVQQQDAGLVEHGADDLEQLPCARTKIAHQIDSLERCPVVREEIIQVLRDMAHRVR